MLMKFISALLLSVFAVAANAAFIGGYDPSNWTIVKSNTNHNGSAIFSGVPADTLTITGSDNGGICDDFGPCYIDALVNVANSGSIQFDWLDSGNIDGGFETFGFLLNGAFTQLSDLGGDSASESVSVSAGDVFGFRADSSDDDFGAGVFIIDEFSYNGSVPEPTILGLLGLGLAGLGLFRRKKKA